ncbi:ankyrin [Stipitochalara longipes BDJ]|nr:ankyrin [Stipitochalara longipes BDJ]
MAEVLGVVASGLSVAQIAGQLLSCIQGLRALCRALRDTPGELQGILDELEILGEIFYQLGPIQTGTSQPGHSALQASLTHCRKAASKLDILANQTLRPLQRSKHATWFRVKAVLKLEEVRDLKVQLERAKSLLHLAMTCYSLHITLLEVRNTGVCNPFSDRANALQAGDRLEMVSQEDTGTVQTGLSRYQHVLRPSKCSPRKCYCSCHSSSTRSGKLWTLKVPYDWNPCDKTTCHNYKRTSFWFSLANIGIPYVIRASLDIMWTTNQSYISPLLQVTRVVDSNAPAFALLEDIKWNAMTFEEARNGMMALFDSRAASPLDILSNGQSLPEKLLRLPWHNGDTQLKLLEFLVILGSPLNTDGILRCCSGWKGLGRWKTGLGDRTAAHTNLLKQLLRLGFDPSESPTFVEWPKEISPMPSWCYGFAGSSPLQEAILIDSAQVVQLRVRNSQAQEEKNVLAQSPLHLAVWRSQHLQTLLEAGFDVNARDWNGRTPLMYAAAAGMRDVAVALVQAGADIWIRDILHSRHTWLEYGTLSTHWPLVLDVIDVVRQSSRFSPDEIQNLLDAAIKSWARTTSKARNSSQFATILQWGVDPDIRFTAKWPTYKASSSTLLHCIENSTDFDTLLRAGFTSFNHSDSRGSHALMTQISAGDPELIHKSINAGSRVDHQDLNGNTALHVCAEFLRSGILSIVPQECDFRFQLLKIAKVLLSSGADPFLADHCHCPCSISGCTPAGMLLKDFHQKIQDITHRSYPLTMHSWVNQWFQLLKGIETDDQHSKRFYLDMIRLSKFEQLELTHTCCRFTNHEYRHWVTLEDEDVEEIRDEEQELSVILESEMNAIQLCSVAELEFIWRKEMDKLMQLQGNNFMDVGHVQTTLQNSAVEQRPRQLSWSPRYM